jgi:hypothetical protein
LSNKIPEAVAALFSINSRRFIGCAVLVSR